MCLSAEERYKHRQVLCKRLLNNCNACEECNIRVVLMVPICHNISDTKFRKPDVGVVSAIYIVMRHKNKRLVIIADPREVCNASCQLCDLLCRIPCQKVRRSVKAVRAVRNTCVFPTETRVVADGNSSILHFN
jgi:hypothetical protein